MPGTNAIRSGRLSPPAAGWALAAMAIPVMILADTAHKAWRATLAKN
ncbi:hypothetical protein ACGFNP_01245 [Nonomuraea sp. NPDC049269]